MNESKPVEIVCPSCGREALLRREPKYEGFTRVGESLSCASCGHAFADEAQVPFKHREAVRVFTDADRSADVKVFGEDEKGRVCRYCVSYIVNPFTQWCATHKREVEATDTCNRFAQKPPPKQGPI